MDKKSIIVISILWLTTAMILGSAVLAVVNFLSKVEDNRHMERCREIENMSKDTVYITIPDSYE